MPLALAIVVCTVSGIILTWSWCSWCEGGVLVELVVKAVSRLKVHCVNDSCSHALVLTVSACIAS